MGKRLDHQPPGWVYPDETYFITVCAQERSHNSFCHPEIGKTILETIRYRTENQTWYCSLALLMPDHIHLILDFSDNVSMTKYLRDWKSWLAKTHKIRWQEKFFDHRLRNEEQISQKADYILYNPVRAGLVSKIEDWPYVWISGG